MGESEESEESDASNETEETEEGNETEDGDNDDEEVEAEELVDELADKLVDRVLETPEHNAWQADEDALTEGDEELDGNEELEDSQLEQVLGLRGGMKKYMSMNKLSSSFQNRLIKAAFLNADLDTTMHGKPKIQNPFQANKEASSQLAAPSSGLSSDLPASSSQDLKDELTHVGQAAAARDLEDDVAHMGQAAAAQDPEDDLAP